MAEESGVDGLEGRRMSDEEIETFLTEQGTGVLALADGGHAYAVPISFGYTGGRLYFAYFSFTDEPRKATATAATETACLAVYDVESVFRWRSVLAMGPIEPVGPDRWDEVGVAMGDNAWSPDLSSLGPRRLTVDTYVLEVEELTGRQGSGVN